jgi:hypothetical protein
MGDRFVISTYFHPAATSAAFQIAADTGKPSSSFSSRSLETLFSGSTALAFPSRPARPCHCLTMAQQPHPPAAARPRTAPRSG